MEKEIISVHSLGTVSLREDEGFLCQEVVVTSQPCEYMQGHGPVLLKHHRFSFSCNICFNLQKGIEKTYEIKI